MKTEGKIIFAHLEKTGGSFIESKMRSQFSFSPPENTYVKNYLYGNFSKQEKIVFKQFFGTFTWGGWDGSHPIFNINKPMDEDFFFTLIRNPTDRFFSLIYNMKSYGLKNWADACLSEKIRYENKIIFDRTEDMWIDILLEGKFTKYEKSRYDKLNLDKFDFVGITDDMTDTLLILNSIFDTNFVNNNKMRENVFGIKNYNHRKNEIKDYLKKDYLIYNEFRKKLQKTLKAG